MKFKVSKLFVFSILFILSLFVSLRGQTNDTQRYFDIFLSIDDLNLLNPLEFYNTTGIEVGFGWYSYLISFFSKSSFILFLPISLAIFHLIYKISIRSDSNFIFTLFVYLSSSYFAIWQFMQIRQGISVVLALYGVTFLLKEYRSYFYFILLSILAICFHQSSVFLSLLGGVLAIFLDKNITKIRHFKFYVLVLVFLSIALSKFVILDVLMNFSQRVGEYVNTEFSESEGIFRLPNIKAILLFLFFLMAFNWNQKKDKVITLFFLFFSISLAFRIGFSDFGILSGRLSAIFGFVEVFLIPIFMNKYNILGRITILLYITFQGIITYIVQVPDLWELYLVPLE